MGALVIFVKIYVFVALLILILIIVYVAKKQKEWGRKDDLESEKPAEQTNKNDSMNRIEGGGGASGKPINPEN